MTKNPDSMIVCRVKQYRQESGFSQSELAERVGVKRQAIFDIESGRYLPNTAVSLRLSRHLGCRVEDLFVESQGEDQPVIMAEHASSVSSRVSLARIRGRLVGHPLEGMFAFSHEFRAADGILNRKGDRVKLLDTGPQMENAIFLMGCDPAFSILSAHVSRKKPEARLICRFASSRFALNALSAGNAHMAGIHYHDSSGEDLNLISARENLAGIGGMVVGFSMIEEGFMVAPGNPHGIRSASDLASPGIRFVNREPGAALRALLDSELAKNGVPASSVSGYEREVHTHLEGAQMVAFRGADAALGMRSIACASGLDFVKIIEVRCDLVIPADLTDHPTIRQILDVMQTRELREEIGLLPGYDTAKTGNTIACIEGR